MTLTTLMTFQISQTCASDLQLFHQTFQAFQVTMLADIVYASRKYIHMSSFQCIGITLSLYRWPICKYNITSNHTEIWQLVLHWIAYITRLLHLPLEQWLVDLNMTLPFHHTDRGLIHIQSPELWNLHLPAQQLSQHHTITNNEVYKHEFEVVEPFESPCWVTDATTHAATGMLTFSTITQANSLQHLHSLPPHITVHMWRNFESFIKFLNENEMGCLFDFIIGPLPVWYINCHDMRTLLLDGTQLFASTDGSVCDHLKSSSAGWLF